MIRSMKMEDAVRRTGVKIGDRVEVFGRIHRVVGFKLYISGILDIVIDGVTPSKSSIPMGAYRKLA